MNRILISVCTACLAAYASLAAHVSVAAEPITEKNWVNHPEIAEVRAIYQQVEAARKAGSLKESVRKFNTAYCPYQDAVRLLLTDGRGTPRYYYYDAGSEDSMVTSTMYYDERGKLRFALVTGGAVNDTKEEARVYFSRAGVKIWGDEKLLEGPGYPFVGFPDGQVVEDPVLEFNSPNDCPEVIKTGHPLNDAELDKIAAQRFDKQLGEGNIQGAGQIFGIVAACDRERLELTAQMLAPDEIGEQVYDFTLKVNKLLKSQAAIDGEALKETVKRCIIDKYYEDPSLPSGSWLHPVTEIKVRFAAVMAKGRKPLLPKAVGAAMQKK